MAMKPEVQRAKQRRRERQECPVHSYQKHGKEAHELREGIKKIINSHCGERVTYQDPEGLLDGMCDDLQSLLDQVDARDSLAYLERCPEDVKRRKGTDS
jgi:hypothetical protein